MTPEAKKVKRTYITITLLATFATSFIWGVNTLFLLDAGLSNTEAFAANAFFTAGMMLFEIPTGVVADTVGRRTSYLMGAATLLLSTLFYLYLWNVGAPFWAWALSSVLLGLGFTFFSGAVEAWLVDAMEASGYNGPMEKVFARGQIAAGIAMLTGSVAGGVIAQFTNLGVPFIMRAVMLALAFMYAFFRMHDIGFKPEKNGKIGAEVKKILNASLEHGIKNRPVRWLMLASPFSLGAGVYAFYAMQPYLLELYGDPEAYSVAGLAAAAIAGAQVAGGLLVPVVHKRFRQRTTVILTALVVGVVALVLIGLTNSFVVAVILLIVWAAAFTLSSPMRQAYINGMIPSKQRATVLSFDALMGSSGGVVSQPVLGRAADAWSYSTSYLLTAGFALLAIPFSFLSRTENHEADSMDGEE